jgi:hypothetical protein
MLDPIKSPILEGAVESALAVGKEASIRLLCRLAIIYIKLAPHPPPNLLELPTI